MKICSVLVIFLLLGCLKQSRDDLFTAKITKTIYPAIKISKKISFSNIPVKVIRPAGIWTPLVNFEMANGSSYCLTYKIPIKNSQFGILRLLQLRKNAKCSMSYDDGIIAEIKRLIHCIFHFKKKS